MTLCVLMATFNDERYLKASLDSILAQTYSEFELLVVNDGSTDSTAAILQHYATLDARLRILNRETNVGLARALNLGLAHTNAEFIARMDADDISLPDRLQKQMEYLRSHPEVTVLGSFAEDIDEFGSRTGRIRRMPVGVDKNTALVWTNPVIHPTILFRAEKIKELAGYDATLRRRQDYDLWFRVIASGMKIDNLPEVLLLYRETAETFRKNGTKAMWQQMKIGIRGCHRIGAGPVAYLGVAVPLIVSLFPISWRRVFKRALSKVDPRNA